MKNSKVTNVVLRFVQESKKGERVLQGQDITLETIQIDEIVGSIVKMVTDVREMVHNKQIKLSGFSFNRKYDLQISINGREYASIGKFVEKTLGKEQALASRKTWIITDDEDKNKLAFARFCADVKSIVERDMKFEGNNEILSLDEAKQEVFGAKYLNA